MKIYNNLVANLQQIRWKFIVNKVKIYNESDANLLEDKWK